MNYSLKRVWWQLKYHWKMYLFIMLEYAIGTIVLVYCMNIFLSSGDTLKDMKNSMSEDMVSVSCPRSLEKFPLEFDTYLELSAKYRNDLVMSFAYTCRMEYYTQNSYEYMNIIFMNNEFFEDLFSIEPKENTVYVGKEAYNLIQALANKPENGTYDGDIICQSEEFLSYTNERISILGEADFNMIVLQDKGEQYINKSYNKSSDNIEVKKSVIFPLNNIVNIKNITPSVPDCILRLKPVNDQNGDAAMANLVSDLSRLQEGHQFSLADKYLEMKNTVESLNIKYENYFIMACAVLLIVVTGIIGILLIFLYRRKKSMAISLSYGATFGRISGELLLEILLVLLSGCILGLAGAYICTIRVNLFYTEVVFYPQSAILAVGVTFTGAMLSCFLALLGIKKEEPIQILKDM